MGLLTGAFTKRGHDPYWDLEGKGVRRRRRLRRLQAFLAWIDLGAMVLLVLAGPAVFRMPALF